MLVTQVRKLAAGETTRIAEAPLQELVDMITFEITPARIEPYHRSSLNGPISPHPPKQKQKPKTKNKTTITTFRGWGREAGVGEHRVADRVGESFLGHREGAQTTGFNNKRFPKRPGGGFWEGSWSCAHTSAMGCSFYRPPG